MKYKIVPNFISIILAIILAAAISKQLDFKQFTFEQPVLVIVYIVALIICVGMMIKKK